LPIAVVPHPFGPRTRDQVKELAVKCAADIARLACEAASVSAAVPAAEKVAARVEVSDDADAIQRLFRERRWSDGLPVIAPTAERVARMLRCTPRAADEVVATVAPGFGAATVERIAINAVMAGCDPECLPVVIAAVEAVTSPAFNLQGIQTTTNPATPWIIVNGPIAERLNMNSGINCLGQGNWANATIGRALRLVLQNIGRAFPGEMDRATQGQPGKYIFCCAENEAQNPWQPLHVERGLKREQSAVTAVGAEGTLNMNTHSKTADEILTAFARTLMRPSGNDYWYAGNPWVILCPEHAEIIAADGLSKADVKRRLWEMSKLPASQLSAKDFGRTQTARAGELGDITRDSMLPICPTPDGLGILVAGGPGTHSVLVPSFGNTRSVTREVIWAG
jgi:hypothetical protein